LTKDKTAKIGDLGEAREMPKISERAANLNLELLEENKCYSDLNVSAP